MEEEFDQFAANMVMATFQGGDEMDKAIWKMLKDEEWRSVVAVVANFFQIFRNFSKLERERERENYYGGRVRSVHREYGHGNLPRR